MNRVYAHTRKSSTRALEQSHADKSNAGEIREDKTIALPDPEDRQPGTTETEEMARLNFEHHGRYLEQKGYIDENEVYHTPIDDHSESSSEEMPSTADASGKASRRAKRQDDVPRAAEEPHQAVTARQVAELIGVVVTAPLRLLFGLGAAALGTAAQAASSIHDAIWPEAQPPMPWRATSATKKPVSSDTYRRRMIIKLPDTTRLWDPIDPQVAHAQIKHGVRDKNVISLALNDNILKVNTPQTHPLSKLELTDRLDFEAHGTETEAGGLSPSKMAELLQGLGLKKVGVINLGACNAGTANYLPELAQELHQRGIEFGWLAGTKGYAANYETSSRIGGSSYSWKWMVLPWRRTAGMFKPAALNRRLVPGNVDVKFKNTVFDADRPWWKIASRW